MDRFVSNDPTVGTASTVVGPTRHSLHRVRRYAERELELAKLGSPELSGVEVDDILDELFVDLWDRWPSAHGDTLPGWLLLKLHERIDAAAESSSELDRPTESLVDPWLRDNDVFWPDQEQLSFEELLPGPPMGPHELTALFEHVPPAERRAVLLQEVEGSSSAAIAEVLGVSEAEAEALVERGIERLLAARG